MSFALYARIRALAPICSRLYSEASPAIGIQVPQHGIRTPHQFLKAIGREADTKVSVGSWDELLNINKDKLKEAGVEVRDRRYILWALQKFRLGEDPIEYAHQPRPKKKIRGRGPAVQNGKRIRSRRKQ